MRFEAGPPPPRPRASSVGTPAGALSMVAMVVMPAASSPPGPFHLRDFGGRDFVLTIDAPAGDQDHDDSGDKVEDYQPPDVPDKRKAQDGCKESGNETGGADRKSVV